MKRRGLILGLAMLLGLGAALSFGRTGGSAQTDGEPGVWRPMGPEGGGAHVLALSPDFPSDGVAFGGNAFYIRTTKTGLGLFKSTDGGRSWALSATTNETDTRITAVNALAVSPNFDADHTVFAGTGIWLFKSTDAGTTWTQIQGVGNLLYGVSAVAVAPDYAASGHVMAVSGNTLYLSTNGGVTWTQRSGADYGRALAYSPDFAADQTAFIGGEGLWKTSNGGITWTKILSQSAWTIAVSPNFAHDRTLFTGGFDGPIYVSHDAGATWNAYTASITAGTVNALAVSPAYVTDTTLFAGCHGGLYRSEDGGERWEAVTSYPGLRVESLAISPAWPADPTLLVGTPAGVYRTADGGTTWTRHGFTTLEISLLTSAQTGRRLFAGTAYQGLFQSADAGEHWTPSALYPPAFIDVAAVPGYPAMPRLFASVVAGAGLGLYRSDDGGQTWKILSSTDIPGGDWAFSPRYAEDGTVFLTARGQVLRSTYHGWGGEWAPVGEWPEGVSGAAHYVLLSPDYPTDATLWAAGGGFWRLAPGATLWVSATLPLPHAQISDIAQSPDFRRDRTLLATGSGREEGEITRRYTVFRSEDAGSTWTTATLAFSDTTPLIGVSFSPRFAVDRTAYVVSRKALFRSTDGGKRWVTVGAPPDVETLYDVVAHGDGHVSVATSRGVWQYSTDWEEVLVNGGFEAGGMGWHMPQTPLPAGITEIVTHTGRRATRIGVGAGSRVPTETAYSSVRQTLLIPEDTLTATLRFSYYPQSEEVVTSASPLAVAALSPQVEGDLQYAVILESGEFLFRELVDAAGWLSHTVALSDYAGETITLHFGVINDGKNGHTGMYLDDVSLLTRRWRSADLTEQVYLPLVLRQE